MDEHRATGRCPIRRAMRVGYDRGARGLHEAGGAGRPARAVRPVVRRGRGGGVGGGGSPSPTRWSWRPSTPDGWPAARTVLLKGYDAAGLRFFTNTGSAKADRAGREPAGGAGVPLAPAAPPGAGDRDGRAGCPTTSWRRTSRPGRASRSSAPGPARSPRSSRSRAELDARLAEVAARFPEDEPVPVPPHWGGYRVVPVEWSSGRAAPGGCTTGCATYARRGATAGPGPASAWPPRQQRPPGLRAQGTCPAQARGSGDCLGFAGSREPVIRSASGAARGASWQPPHASDKYSRVRTTSLPCTEDRTSRSAGSQRNSAVSRQLPGQMAIQVDSAWPSTRPSLS